MSVTYHKYLRQGEELPPEATKARGNGSLAKERLDRAWRQERIAHERSKRALADTRLARSKRELIPRELALKQAAFLVLSLRARLLAIPEQHAGELTAIADERVMAGRLDAILRTALDELVGMPEKVTDEHWLEKLDEESAAPQAKRAKRVAK